MKKVIIAMVALLVVAGGSFGAFLAVRNKSDKETEKQVSELAENDLFSFDSETVTEISFDCPDGQYKVLHDGDMPPPAVPPPATPPDLLKNYTLCSSCFCLLHVSVVR